MTHEEAQARARETGVSRVAYFLVKLVIVPFLRVVYRLKIVGAEHVPDTGAAIIAPNHKSFFDSFFIAVATGRHLRFMGKSELFTGLKGRLLIALGAFPVKRGASDQDALATARHILDEGGLLALFPEGTRVRESETLGTPKKGAARLALESGAPLVPCAITGTEKLFFGPLPRPHRVQVAFSEPIPVDQLEATPEAAEQITEGELWPEIERSFGDLLKSPGAIAAGLAALGVGGAVAYRRRKK
jgi:1-acyl-sn-glycerol-3-phosphate acyltransferase